MKCDYKVKRISGDLEKYLNEKDSQGWRCVSVTTATGLGWTHIIVLERAVEDQPIDTVIKIIYCISFSVFIVGCRLQHHGKRNTN